MVANAVPGIAVGVAAQTPDNPLQGVTTQTSGLVRLVKRHPEGPWSCAGRSSRGRLCYKPRSHLQSCRKLTRSIYQ